MRLNLVLASLAATLLLSACNNTEECSVQSVDVARTSAPGTPGDFKANIKDRVFYDLNKATLSGDAKKTLEAQAAWLKTHSSTKATIEGHCDQRGTKEFNLALGEKRASAAKKELSSLGITADRLKTISYGKEKPPVEGNTPEAWAQQRTAITSID